GLPLPCPCPRCRVVPDRHGGGARRVGDPPRLPRGHAGPQRRRPRAVGACHAVGERRCLPARAVGVRRQDARRPSAEPSPRRAQRLRGGRAGHRPECRLGARTRL
ncbi:MAG: hypothetical protein AVDCRST_MAG60-842, partial [uncultured Nocardioides sp.]